MADVDDELDGNFALLLEGPVTADLSTQPRASTSSSCSSDFIKLPEIPTPLSYSEGSLTPSVTADNAPPVVTAALPPPVVHPIQDASPTEDDPDRLTVALKRFYEVYNPENADKVDTLAKKFDDKRSELWEQLTIKYRLSVSASSKLFVELFIDRSSEAVKYLFGCTPLYIRDESDILRASQWRGLLGFTEEELQAKRTLYKDFLNEIDTQYSTSMLTAHDDTSMGTQIKLLRDMIQRDVNRTHQESGFFHDAQRKQQLCNILLVYSRMNGVPYVQGMNEIAAVMLFALKNESDAFWLLNTVLGEMQEIFLPDSDSTDQGVYKQIDSIAFRLHQLHPQLFNHLNSINFPLSTVCLRWITTLLSMELTLPDVLKVWDTLLLSLRVHGLRSLSSCIVLGYLTLMRDELMVTTDLESCMPVVTGYGRGVHMNVDLLIMCILANYAHEMKVKDKYVPESFPFLETFSDAVSVAKGKLFSFLDSVKQSAVVNDFKSSNLFKDLKTSPFLNELRSKAFSLDQQRQI